VVRAEAEDRFGVLPTPVLTLFGVASLKLMALSLGVTEITTFRTQARIKPVPEAVGYEVASEAPEATYHATTNTLNLELPQTMGGAELTAWIERAMVSGAA
jgi:transcription-repair coupling factor (superfamily II helicase)